MPARVPEPRFLEPVLGIVFDLDGTLVISRHDFGRMRHEVIRLAERYGVAPGRLSPEEPLHRTLDAAREELRASEASTPLLIRFDGEVHQLIDGIEMQALDRTTARAGASALLRGLQERSFRLGLLTRSSDAFARGALARTQLDRFFPFMRTRSAPGPAKPSPESLLHLLSEMGVPVERALYVGDHLIDAECATRAGVRFYAVLPDPSEPSSMSVDRFLAAGASAIANDLPELARHLQIASPPQGPVSRIVPAASR
ncbi:MAG: HAD family hydrolase [Thermoplasmata archaeon]|jgi:phosphoglycolate phosphatase